MSLTVKFELLAYISTEKRQFWSETVRYKRAFIVHVLNHHYFCFQIKIFTMEVSDSSLLRILTSKSLEKRNHNKEFVKFVSFHI